MEHAFNHSTLGRLRQDDDRLQASLGYKETLFPRKQASKHKGQAKFPDPTSKWTPKGTCSLKQGRPWSLTEEAVPPAQLSHSLLQRLCPGKPPDVSLALVFHPQKTGTCPDIPSSDPSIFKATGLLNGLLALKLFFKEPFWGSFLQLGPNSGEATILSRKIASIRNPSQRQEK